MATCGAPREGAALQSNQYSGRTLRGPPHLRERVRRTATASRTLHDARAPDHLLCCAWLLVACGAAALRRRAGDVKRLHAAGQTAAALRSADKLLAARPEDAQLRFLNGVLLAETASARRGASTSSSS